MEIRPNKRKIFNQPVWGLLFGIILPLIFFFGVFLIFYFTGKIPELSPKMFYDNLGNSFMKILSLCVLSNLLIYLLFKQLGYWYAIKGLVTSILVYVIVVIILMFI
jgi:hypothetical protein